MLSIENPPPADPHPCQVTKKNNSVGCNNGKKFSNLPDLDPSSSHNHHHNQNPNPISNFSIRDYVVTARRKDIKKNWPFSIENLQLCFKHGIRDPLPPFQTPEAVKDQSSERSTVEAVSNDDHHHKIDNALKTNKSLPDHGRKCKSRTENELPSTSTSVHQSDIESVKAVHTVLEPSAINPPSPRKTETVKKSASKRCRLVVKYGSIPSEDIASNSTDVSESMASNTCPVCKTFSSSSNTTLNAHIDQCLAANSKPEVVPGSKQARHKIKPRKIRLMTEIYATAKCCTLEELDRRNGTSWASLAISFPALDANMADPTDEAENQMVSPACSYEAAGDEAPVYIDANGTKVGILSKLDDATIVSKAGKAIGPSKSLKGGEGSKFFLSKKKSRHGKRRHKFLKLVPQSRKLISQKLHASQISTDLEGYHSEGTSKRDVGRMVKESKPIQIPETSKQWVPANRSALAKERNKQQYKTKPPAEKDNDSLVRRNEVQKLKNAKACGEVRVMDKRARSRNVGSTEMPFLSSKLNADRSSKISISVSAGPKIRAPKSRMRKKFCPIEATFLEVSPHTSSKKPTMETHAFRSRTLKVSSSRKKVSIWHQSLTKPKLNALNQNRLHLMAKKDKDFVALQPGIDQECDLMYNGADDHHEDEMVSDDTCFGTSEVLSREGVVASKSLRMALQHNHQDDGESEDFSFKSGFDDDDDDTGDDSESDDDDNVLEDFDDPESTAGRASSVSEFLDTKFSGSRNHSKTSFDSPETSDDYTRASLEGEALIRPAEPSFFGVQGIDSSDHEVGNRIGEQDAHMVMKLDSETGQGSSFPEVEPIPIPGPPGSFLPSPRGMMGSDNFPGNSSLTNSPVQSYEDRRDFVDKNLSDSPISMASTISNSTAGRSDHINYVERRSSVQENTTLSFPSAETDRPLDSAATSQQTSLGDERNFKEEKFSIKKKAFGFRSDDQPCCCQRKERTSQVFITLNFQEFRQGAMASMAAPVIERQMSINPGSKPNNLNPRSNASSLSICPVSKPETVNSIPSMKPFAEESSPEHGEKFSDSFRNVSPSPSPSNPILRLMGKNLMVINRDDSVSENNLNPPLSAAPSVVPSTFQNQDVNGSHYVPHCDSLMYGQGSCDATGIFDAGNNFGNNISCGLPQNPIQVSPGTLQDQITSLFSYVHGESPVLQNAEFSVFPSRQANKSQARFGCIPEVSGKIHGSSFGFCNNQEHTESLASKNSW